MNLRSSLVALGCLIGCAPAESPPRPPVHREPEPAGYLVRVSPALDRIDVRACLEGSPELVPQSELARDLASVPRREGECTSYSVDVSKATERADLRGALRLGDALLASPDLWLWKPEPLSESSLSARFELFPGGQVAVAWPELGSERRVPETTFRWASQAAFGRFDRERIAVGSSFVDVAFLGSGWNARRQKVVSWLGEAARMTADTYGGFPVESATVLAVAGRGRSFGLVLRGGGPTVVLRVGAGDLDQDWTAVHELLHLGVPHIDLEHAWLYEGLVQYQTTLARARAGKISRERAWWELLDGFERGRRAGTGRTLAQESLDMHATRAYWRVYWAGAAIALETDVELHKANSSLSTALAGLAKSSAGAVGLGPDDVISEIDRDVPGAPLRTISTRELGRRNFPDVGRLGAWLGVKLDGERVVFSDDAPGRALREQLIP